MNKKPTVLFIDDEERILRSLAMMFKPLYQVYTTTDPDEAMAVLKREHIHVMISDQRMPNVQGVELLRRAREVSPRTMRLLLTGYSDLAAIVGSINEGEIFRYINKPWDPAALKSTVALAAQVAEQLEHIVEPNAVPDPSAAPTPAVLVLVIDDQESVYKEIRELLKPRCDVHWGQNLDQAFSLLSEHDFAVLITDVRLHGQDITAALKSLKQASPRTLALVLSTFQDTRVLIDLINQGQVFRYLPKPLRPHMLQISMDAAITHYQRIKRAPALLLQHQVEAPPTTTLATVPAKIMGFLRRIKERFVAETAS